MSFAALSSFEYWFFGQPAEVLALMGMVKLAGDLAALVAILMAVVSLFRPFSWLRTWWRSIAVLVASVLWLTLWWWMFPLARGIESVLRGERVPSAEDILMSPPPPPPSPVLPDPR